MKKGVGEDGVRATTGGVRRVCCLGRAAVMPRDSRVDRVTRT